MPSIPVNDAQLYYLQDGSGEDVVLLHGLASNLAFWYSGVMVPLRRHYRVTAYDLRGHGKSSMPATGYTHFAMADDLAGLVDVLQIERFHLIGHSYGGLVSLTYAQQYPDHLLSLTLADVPVDDPVVPGQSMDKNTGDKYPELGQLERLAKNPVPPNPKNPRFIPFHQGKGSAKTAKQWLKLLETTSARQDFRTRNVSLQELQRLQIPTLLTYGFKSGWKNSGELLKHYLPDTNFVYIHNAGHSHPWEKPGFFLQSWINFVQTLRVRPVPERRQNLRNRINLLLELQTTDGRKWMVSAVDVSTTGILINSPEDCWPGTSIRLDQKNIQEECITISGRIIRHDDMEDGYLLAIQFDNTSESVHFLGYVQDIINIQHPLILNNDIQITP